MQWKPPPHKILEKGPLRWFRAVSFAVSLRFRWPNETTNETAKATFENERNRKIPVSRYKYYNPANRTCPVSFHISRLVRGFVRFRCTKFSVSFDFFMVSLVSLVSLLKNRCRKSGFRAGVFRASYDMLSPKNFSANASFSATWFLSNFEDQALRI